MFPSVRTLLASLGTCLLAAAASAATVSGTVSSAATAKPLASMTVAAYDTTGVLRGSATTDANGHYSLTLPADHYRLLAYDPAGIYATAFAGGAESFDTSAITDASSSATVNFTLVKAGTIAGSVRANVVVAAYNLSGTRRAFTNTSPSGTYQLVLPPGDYKIVAYDEGGVYATLFYGGARAFADAAVVHVAEAQTTAATFRLDVAAHVNGTAIPGILIYAYTAEGAFVSATAVNAAGTFSLALAPGTYKLVAADPNRVYAAAFSGGAHSFATASILDVDAGETIANYTFALERGAKIGGHVSPVSTSVVVFAYNLDGTAHTSARPDVSGAYELLAAPGTYKLAAVDESAGYATQFYAHRSDFASASAIYVAGGTSQSGFDFTLERAARISGSVGLANINVQAYDSAGVLVASTRSGSDGRYTLVVAPGAYRIVAFDDALAYATSYAGGATSFDGSAPVVAIADTVVSADIALRRGVRLDGTAYSIEGEPLDDVEVFALDATEHRAASTTAHGGMFALSLAPGSYHFIAYDRTGRFAPQSLDEPLVIVEGHAPLPIHFVLSGAGRRRATRH